MGTETIKLNLLDDWQYHAFNEMRRLMNESSPAFEFSKAENRQLYKKIKDGNFTLCTDVERFCILEYLCNVEHRIVPPKKRQVLIKDEIDLYSAVPADQLVAARAGVAQFIKESESGQSIEKRQSGKRLVIDEKDVLLDRCGIHHFHIQEKPQKRGDWVVFAFVNDQVVKLIKVDRHRIYSQASEMQKLLEVAYKNYPEQFDPYCVSKNNSFVTEVSPDTQKSMSWCNLNVGFTISGKVFYPPGHGVMLNGVSMKASNKVMAGYRFLQRAQKAFDAYLKEHEPELLSHGVQEFHLYSFDNKTICASTHVNADKLIALFCRLEDNCRVQMLISNVSAGTL